MPIGDWDEGTLQRFVERFMLEKAGTVTVPSVRGLADQLSSITSDIADLTADGISGGIFDAKGDLIAASGNDAYDNLAAGSNGTFLKADNAQTLGLIWAALAMSDVTGLVAALAAKQDASTAATDSELTAAIAALSTVYQPLSAKLTALAALTWAANKGILLTGTGTVSTFDLTAAGLALLDDADASAQRTTLGLGALAVLSTINGSLWSGSDLAVVDGGTGASNASGARTNLGVIIGTDVAAQGDSRFPTAGEKAAMPGTDGSPGSTNKYVTDSDGRLNATQLTLPQAILALDPSLYWDLGANGATDLSGNSRNGTGQGSITLGGSTVLTSDGGTSTNFDGSNDYISSAYAVFAAASVRSFVLWVNWDTTPASYLFGGSGSAGPYAQMTAGAPPLLRVDFNATGGGAAVGANPILTTTQTYALGFVFDEANDKVKVFVNGAFLGSFAHTDSYSTPGNLVVGNAFGAVSAGSFIDAKIAHFAVFEKELSASTFSWLALIGQGQSHDRGLVSTLPANALSGDTCQYVADNTNGVVWNLIYDGQGTYPWKAIHGPPLRASSNTSRTGPGAAYANLATDPLSITLPLAGDFDITIEGFIQNPSGTAAALSYAVGATAASDDWAAQTGTVAIGGSFSCTTTHTGLAASISIAEKAKAAGAGTGAFDNRRLRVAPVRVG